jgi:hypothetical protein
VIFGQYEDQSDSTKITRVHAYRVDEFGNQIRMEHEVWVLHNGPIPGGFEAFHKNGVTLDNRDSNIGLRPIEPRRFRLGIFPTVEENIGARNILEAMVRGEKAVFEKSDPPEPVLFWRVIRELQDQGLSMMQGDVEAYKVRCMEYLHMDLIRGPEGIGSRL